MSTVYRVNSLLVFYADVPDSPVPDYELHEAVHDYDGKTDSVSCTTYGTFSDISEARTLYNSILATCDIYYTSGGVLYHGVEITQGDEDGEYKTLCYEFGQEVYKE